MARQTKNGDAPIIFAQASIVMRCVESYFGVSRRQIRGKRRQKALSHVRHCAMSFVRDVTPLSYPEIGAMFHRDHSTVIHGIEKYKLSLCSSFSRRQHRQIKTLIESALIDERFENE